MRTARWLLAAAASTLVAQAALAQTATNRTATNQTAPMNSTMPMNGTAPMAPASQPAPSAAAAGAMSQAAPAPTVVGAPGVGSFVRLTPQPGQDIVAVLTASGQFTTLLKAVEATGLTPVLKSAGPLTIFAPNDAAFAKMMSASDLDAATKDQAKLQQLQGLLTYHVVNAKLPAIKGHAQTAIQTVAPGKKVTVDGVSEPPKVNDANVLQGDVQASNGVIFVIDKVLSPDFVAPPAPAASEDAATAPEAAATTTTKSTSSTSTAKSKKKR